MAECIFRHLSQLCGRFRRALSDPMDEAIGVPPPIVEGRSLYIVFVCVLLVSLRLQLSHQFRIVLPSLHQNIKRLLVALVCMSDQPVSIRAPTLSVDCLRPRISFATSCCLALALSRRVVSVPPVNSAPYNVPASSVISRTVATVLTGGPLVFPSMCTSTASHFVALSRRRSTSSFQLPRWLSKYTRYMTCVLTGKIDLAKFKVSVVKVEFSKTTTAHFHV